MAEFSLGSDAFQHEQPIPEKCQRPTANRVGGIAGACKTYKLTSFSSDELRFLGYDTFRCVPAFRSVVVH